MFKSFTNAVEDFKGKKIVVNTDFIITVFEGQNEEKTENFTILYGGDKGFWQVQESIESVIKILNQEK
jgi:hypothetical protein